MTEDGKGVSVGISVDDAKKRILDAVHVLDEQTVSLMDALGRTLNEDVYAKDAIPPFNNSAMDGYALRYADIEGATEDAPAELRVLEDLPAGSVATQPIGAGEAIRIMTGAPVPDGADAVVMVEKTEKGDGVVKIFTDSWDGQNIRMAGEDVAEGDHILHKGKLLHAGDIGMLASLGYPEVKVIPKPIIAVISTGDELIDVGEELRPGKIRNSNAYSLASQVLEAGAEVRIIGIARDTEEDIREKINQAFDADAIVTSGGVSVGDYDMVKKILDNMGQMLFWKVQQKPAKPLAFGVIEGKPLFGLPGNPTSSMVSFEQFARPAIQKMAGRKVVARQHVNVTIADDIKKRAGLRYFMRVVLTRGDDGGLIASLAGSQSSGALRSMTRAHGLLVLPEELDKVTAGDPGVVQVLYPEDAPL